MSDPLDSAPRRRRSWPFAAMAALVGLLATFLVVKLMRPADDTPEIVNAPPPPAVVPPPPPPAVDSLAEATAAFEAGRLDEAAEKAALAKGPRAEALLAKIEEARKARIKPPEPKPTEEDRQRHEEAAAKEKQQQARSEALAELERIDPESKALTRDYKWDAALALFDAALKKHPVLADIADYATSRRQLEELRNGAAKAFTTNAEKARAELKAGRYTGAMKLARLAESFYPENADGPALLKEISTMMLESNLVLIPATIKGGVKLGDAKQADEPERVFTSPGFLMDKYEVTNEEYFLFVQQTRHRPPPSLLWAGGEPRPGAERYPVTNVSAADAEAFAAWAKKRLPTEDEWEYAARWVDGRVYPWGSTEPDDKKPMCQCLEASLSAGLPPGTRPVGTWPASASPFGVHDLAGSVWEWTSTPFEKRRILKGGSYLSSISSARASNRLPDDADLLHPDVGFRCVKDRP